MTQEMYLAMLRRLSLYRGRAATFTFVLRSGETFAVSVAVDGCAMADGCAVFQIGTEAYHRLLVPLHKVLYLDYKVLRPMIFNFV